MVRSRVAQQDRLVFTAEQRLGDGASRIVHLGGHRCQHARFGAHGVGDAGQGRHPVGAVGQHGVLDRHGPVLRLGIERVHLPPLASRLADALGKQGVVLAQIRSDHQHALQTRQGCDRHAQPAGRVRRCRVEEVGVAQTRVDVLAAQTTHERTGQGQFFHRAVRAGQHTDGASAVVRLDLLQAVGHVFQCGLPVHGFPLAALLEHGRGEAVFAVDGFVAEAVAVGNPAFVHRIVFQRDHAHDPVVLHLNDQVGAGRIVRAHALATREFPGTRAVTERLARERAHRADVDHVARQLGIHRLPDKGFDFGVFTTVRHAQLHHAGHFLAKAHAAGAVDATAHFLHGNQRTDVLVEHHALLFFVARGTAAVAHGQILQLAFTALVTNGAIQRVVDEQELHHRLLGLDGLVGLGAHDHAHGHRRGAGGHGLGGLFHLHQAHAATRRDGQLLVVAEMGNVGARLFSRMHDHAARWHFDLLAVEFDFNHSFSSRFRRWRRP